MENQPVHIPDLSPEFIFQASRSSGPGGQNVNKVNTRVELRFNIPNSAILTEEQRQILLEKLGTKLTADGLLLVTSQDSRSQLMNKEACIRKLYTLLEKALTPRKKRKTTRPTKTSVEKRIQEKKQQAEKKSLRGKIDY
jgi:ribosome-associated protein